MAFSPLPLAYCTNVHPCRAVADVPAVLDRYAAPVRALSGFDISVGLWLPEAAVAEADAADVVGQSLASHGFSCHTLNAFPFGDFHGARVKEQVYLPDWADRRRLDYTLACARLLTTLVPPGGEGSISTLPLGFKGFGHGPAFTAAAADALLDCARRFAALEAATGRVIRLALEPEPCCILETTAETVTFFTALFDRAARAGIEPLARRHLGVCYDVCHQAVEFEDAGTAIGALTAAGIRINKVQISCAIEAPDPTDPAQRDALLAYVEPRYLHQTFARGQDGTLHHAVDLTPDLITDPTWHARAPWRIHYHVPVDAERIGPLRTTRRDLERGLAGIGELDYAPHLEVETYTWPVLPGADPVDLASGIARELIATRALIGNIA
ncbi:MAG: metabolite traffic protein EboE [Planctomycetia bacterium]